MRSSVSDCLASTQKAFDLSLSIAKTEHVRPSVQNAHEYTHTDNFQTVNRSLASLPKARLP